MIIHKAKSAQEAVTLRHEIDKSVYLAGGTEVLRLNSSVPADAEIIDINGLGFDDIYQKDGKLYIGARATLQDIVKSDLVPGFIKKAASFCSSMEKRNAATIGGNIATRREDSYMLASLLASEACLILCCKTGQKEKTLVEYLEKKECRALLEYIVIDAGREGVSKRIAISSGSHAALISACSQGVYALCVSGSRYAVSKDKDMYKHMDFKSDLTGSAEYKRYLASIIFDKED